MLTNGVDSIFKENQVDDTDKVIIEVKETSPGNDDFLMDARTVFWGVYRGDFLTVKHAIILYKMSPTIKCFQDANFVISAVMGG